MTPEVVPFWGSLIENSTENWAKFFMKYKNYFKI